MNKSRALKVAFTAGKGKETKTAKGKSHNVTLQYKINRGKSLCFHLLTLNYHVQGRGEPEAFNILHSLFTAARLKPLYRLSHSMGDGEECLRLFSLIQRVFSIRWEAANCCLITSRHHTD